MAKKAKQTRAYVRADESEYTGVVLPCPLCNDRCWKQDKASAWRWLYYHLRRVHGEMASGQLTQKAMQNYLYARESTDS